MWEIKGRLGDDFRLFLRRYVSPLFFFIRNPFLLENEVKKPCIYNFFSFSGTLAPYLLLLLAVATAACGPASYDPRIAS